MTAWLPALGVAMFAASVAALAALDAALPAERWNMLDPRAAETRSPAC
jgi:hypothetical protein